MKKFKTILGLFAACICLFGCAQERTYLSDEIKALNPYKRGQKLTFMSDFGVESILLITNVQDGRFSEGLGQYQNEGLEITAYRSSHTVRDGTEEIILTLLAKTDKEKEQIDFSISLKEAALVMKYVSLDDYKSRASIPVSTEYDSYDDVLIFENRPNREMHDRAIVEFWWSKSVGYVRLVQQDGTIWDLKSIE